MTGFISVHPSVVLWLSVLFYLSPQIVFPFLLAAGFHELSHIIVLLLLKKPPRSLSIVFSGARLEVPPLSYGEEGIAAAAGPLGSLLLGLLLPLMPTVSFYSLVLGIVNLLPLKGLDGWRISKATLHLCIPPEMAQIVLSGLSISVSVLLFILSVFAALGQNWGLWPLFLSVHLLVRTFISLKTENG